MKCFFILLFLCPSALLAAEFLPAHRAVVEGEVLRGSFTEERHLKDFKAPLLSSGKFVVSPTHGLIWAVEKPFTVTTVITSNGLVQDAGGNQTMHLSAKQIPFLLHLYDMLSGALAGNWTAMANEFEVKNAAPQAGMWQLQLTPKKKDDVMMPFSTISIFGAEFAQRVELNKADGDSDIITFTNQKLSNRPLTKQEAALLMKAP